MQKSSLVCILLLALGLTLFGVTSTFAKSIELKIAHHQPITHVSAIALDKAGKAMVEKSKGGLTVKVFPAEQLGNEKASFDGLRAGIIDISTLGTGIIGSVYPPILALECGYIFRDLDHLQKFIGSDIATKMMTEAAQKTGIRIITMPYNGVRHVTTSNKPVRNPKDFAGVKLRVPTSEMLTATIRAMGANPTPIAFSETYMALQTKTVDGQENPFASILTMKFYEVQKYLCLTGHMVQATTFVVSEKTLQKLPNDLKTLVIDEVRKAGEWQTQEMKKSEASQLEQLKKLGMQVVDCDVVAFSEAMKPVVQQYENKWGAGLYDKIRAIK